MNDSKLVHLFATLDKKEMNSLVSLWKKKQHYEGINGPHIHRLFDYLRKYYEEEKQLTDEKVFAYVYENRAFKRRYLTLLLSAAHKILEKYIIDIQLKYEEQENPLQKQIIILRYLKRQLSRAAQEGISQEALFKRYYNEIERLYEQLKSVSPKEWSGYLDIYMISQMVYYNPTYRRFDNGRITLKVLLDALDKFVYIAKLKHGSEVLVRRRIIDENIGVRLMHEVRRLGNIINSPDDRLVSIYEEYYDLVADDNYQEVKLIALQKLVFESIAYISLQEMNTILILLLNYLSWAARYKHYVAPFGYKIYRFGFSNDMFVDEGVIPPQLLINYCFYCDKMSAHDEIPAILNRHLNQVRENQRDTTKMLCQAYRDFGAGKYKKIFASFLNPGPNLFPFFFTYRSLKIKCIFELGEYISEDGKYYDPRQETANYANTIKEKGYNQEIKMSNLNFSEFVATMDSHKYSRKELQKMLDDYNVIVYYDWLKAKVEEYQK